MHFALRTACGGRLNAAKARQGCTRASAAETGVAGFTAGQRNGRSDAGKGEAEVARSE